MLAAFAAVFSPAYGFDGDDKDKKDDQKKDLTQLSLQELMNVEVTTTSKKAEHLFKVPAAAYVITGEEIRASGARNLPDLLRMVPGITVQQTNSNQWSVASRGFIDTFTNKVLVLVDGRSIYTPTFGGVVWGNQDMILEDIERIEVIRGPGGSLWGANAVTGIINIITKSAKDTVGTFAEGGVGDLDIMMGSYRYGKKFSDDSAIRFYAKYKEFGDTTRFRRTQLDQNDAGNDRRAGFRFDGKLGSGDFMLAGEASGTHYGQVPYVASETDESGLVPEFKLYNPTAYHMIGRLTRNSANGTQDSVQAYFDHATRNIIDSDEMRDTFDIEAQRSHKLNDKLGANYGAGYRWTQDKINGTQFFFFEPNHKTLQYLSLFGQLEYESNTKSKFQAGLKLERNDYTGWEWQPSLRYSYSPDDRKTFWAAASRSVRTPTRFDTESFDLYFFDSEIPGYNTYIGTSDFKSEKQIAYEAGIKLRPSQKLTLDIAGFLNDYKDLRATLPGENYPDPNNPGVMIQPNYIINGLHGQTNGCEVYGKWDARKDLRVFFSYAYFSPNLHFENGAQFDPTISIAYTPRHAASLICDYKVNDKTTLDVGAYWQDRMKDANVPPSTRVDFNLRHKVTDTLEGIISVQNAMKRRRLEGQTTDFTYSSYIPRSVYVGFKLRY
jgi:iron complex outermembrane receptor protein